MSASKKSGIETAQQPISAVNHYEDFEPGKRFAHHWGRTITDSEIVSFAAEYLIHQPQHFNREYARHLGFADLVAPAQLVFAITLGMSVEDLSESGGPFLSANEIDFLEPVIAGDTLYASSEVLSRRMSSSRPGYGIVEWRTQARNARGEPVIRYRRASLVRARQSGETQP
jgi:itaconyl-CoA hydratase